jgi:hypothetical protein
LESGTFQLAADRHPFSFALSADAPELLRGRSFKTIGPLTSIRPAIDEDALASTGDAPIWTTSRIGAIPRFRCGIPIPSLESEEGLCDFVSEDRFPVLVPIIEFLRETKGTRSLRRPLRAALMFDDPNLHWPTYGCLDYRLLAVSAEKHNYHTAIATIPLDKWFSHPAAARVFRENRKWVSLLVHGNNHTYAELVHPPRDECLSYARQALQRVHALEERAGVAVSRVMAPPHGACSENMLNAMVDAGFDAAAISAFSLRDYNHGALWVRSIGFAPTENVGGLPVVPRFRLSSACQSRVLFAAYLGQPIIPVGHHWDVAHGLDLLETTADFVNSLGPVKWLNLRTIAGSNFELMETGDAVRVTLYSRRVRLTIPGKTRRLWIEKSWSSDLESIEVSLNGTRATGRPGADAMTIEADEIGELEIKVTRPKPAGATGAPPATGIWPVTRRLLSECRDRLYPLRHRLRV